MQEEDLKARNIRFNDAIRGTQYEQISDESTPIALLKQRITTLENAIIDLKKNPHQIRERKKLEFKPEPYKTVKDDLDKFKRNELKLNCPPELQEKLELFANPLSSKTQKKALLFYGPPASGKSSLAKLIAYLTKRPYLFLTPGNFSDEYKSSSFTFIDAIFDPLIEKQEEAVLCIDELTGFTAKFNNPNDGDAGAVQHFWTKLDKCRKNPKLIVVATLNDPTTLPAPLRSRCIEYFIGYPKFDARLRILKNYLLSDQVSEKFLSHIGSRTEGYSLRDIEEIIENTKQKCEKRLISISAFKGTTTGLYIEDDIQQAFNATKPIDYNKSKEERYEYWKKLFKEYAPIIIIPLLRMGCDYAIQHAYHQQQVAWNGNCYREGLQIQQRHHAENLNQQRELTDRHHEENKTINEQHFGIQIKQADNHHEDNLKMQRNYQTNMAIGQNFMELGELAAPTANSVVTAVTGSSGWGAAAGVITRFGFIYLASQQNQRMAIPSSRTRKVQK